MPVTEPFTELVEVDDGGVWRAVPAQEMLIKESRNGRIIGISFSVVQTPDLDSAAWAALQLGAKLRITQQVGSRTDQFIAYITRRPRSRPGDVPALAITGHDETILATRVRFIDAWPKAGVRTVTEILTDAWQRYGPAGIALTGIASIANKVEGVTSNLDTLYEFTEELARRYGADWRIRNGELQFWLPETQVWDIPLTEDETIIADSLEIGEEMPHIANVALVPAKVRVADFNDVQRTRAGQGQYFLQYPPLVRQIQTAEGPVYIDDPPQVWVDGVQQTVAEDGAADANSVQCVYSVEGRFVRFNSGHIPTADGQELKVIYTSEFPVIVRREHADSIALFGEIHERIVRDPRPTREEAEKIGDSFQRQRALPIRPIRLETTLFGLRPGVVVPVRIPSEGIDQLMPVTAVERRTRPGQLDIAVVINQLPVTDADAVVDLYRRLNRLEARETSRQQRVELYSDWEDAWSWAEAEEPFETTLFACPIPSELLYPAEDLYPC